METKLYSILDKSPEDKDDVTVWHMRTENLDSVKAEIASRHYGFGDPEYAKKVVNLNTGRITKSFVEEVEEDHGFSPDLDFSDYEIGIVKE